MKNVRMFQDDRERIFIQVDDSYWEMTGREEGQGRADLLDAAHGRTDGWSQEFRSDRRMTKARSGMTMIAEIDEGKFWVFPSFMTHKGRRYLFGDEEPNLLPPASAGRRR